MRVPLEMTSRRSCVKRLFTIQGVETEWRVVLGQVRSSARVQIRLSASTDWSGSSPLAKVV